MNQACPYLTGRSLKISFTVLLNHLRTRMININMVLHKYNSLILHILEKKTTYLFCTSALPEKKDGLDTSKKCFYLMFRF